MVVWLGILRMSLRLSRVATKPAARHYRGKRPLGSGGYDLSYRLTRALKRATGSHKEGIQAPKSAIVFAAT